MSTRTVGIWNPGRFRRLPRKKHPPQATTTSATDPMLAAEITAPLEPSFLTAPPGSSPADESARSSGGDVLEDDALGGGICDETTVKKSMVTMSSPRGTIVRLWTVDGSRPVVDQTAWFDPVFVEDRWTRVM